jgi:hypothetical protein
MTEGEDRPQQREIDKQLAPARRLGYRKELQWGERSKTYHQAQKARDDEDVDIILKTTGAVIGAVVAAYGAALFVSWLATKDVTTQNSAAPKQECQTEAYRPPFLPPPWHVKPQCQTETKLPKPLPPS